MPIYPYRCVDCHKRFEVFMAYSDYGNKPVQCAHCGSSHVERRIVRVRFARSEESHLEDGSSHVERRIVRVRFARSEESHLEDLADPAALEGLEDDPRALGKMMRKMSSEMGEEMGPEFDEVIDRLEAGQSPDEIEQALPDLGGNMDSGAGGLGDFE